MSRARACRHGAGTGRAGRWRVKTRGTRSAGCGGHLGRGGLDTDSVRGAPWGRRAPQAGRLNGGTAWAESVLSFGGQRPGRPEARGRVGVVRHTVCLTWVSGRSSGLEPLSDHLPIAAEAATVAKYRTIYVHHSGASASESHRLPVVHRHHWRTAALERRTSYRLKLHLARRWVREFVISQMCVNIKEL